MNGMGLRYAALLAASECKVENVDDLARVAAVIMDFPFRQFLRAAIEHRQLAEHMTREWRDDVVRVAEKMNDAGMVDSGPVDVIIDLLAELRMLRDEDAARRAERERCATPEGFEQNELFADEEVIDV